MMSTYRIMKDAMLTEIKENIKDYLSSYLSQNNQRFLELLNIKEVDYENDLIVTDLENSSRDDLANSITLYEKYKDIPLSLASNEKFWAFLAHTDYWNYMCQRWPVKKQDKNIVNYIKNRYFFGDKKFYRNGLSRLWWYAYLTYDPNKEDPYYYTRLMLSEQEIANLLIETTQVSRNQVALKAILEVINKVGKLQETGEIKKIKNRRQFIRNLIKYVNLVGGVTLWDQLSEEEAFDKVWEYVDQNIERNLSLRRYIIKAFSKVNVDS